MPVAKSITIVARRWLQRTYGNTYHSAEIIVNGVQVHRIDYAYGYDEMYLWNAFDWLETNGYLPDRKTYGNGHKEAPWQYCQRTGIVFVNSVTDVSRKKDL